MLPMARSGSVHRRGAENAEEGFPKIFLGSLRGLCDSAVNPSSALREGVEPSSSGSASRRSVRLSYRNESVLSAEGRVRGRRYSALSTFNSALIQMHRAGLEPASL